MRFRVAGTDDLVRAFETEAKRSLEDFFERWVYDFDLPTLRFDYHTEARLSGQQGETDVILRFEQRGNPFEIPVTVTLRYPAGSRGNGHRAGNRPSDRVPGPVVRAFAGRQGQ